MKLTKAQLFGTYWVGFTAFFLFLQYLFNDVMNGFALFVSALGALPVAGILALRAHLPHRRDPRRLR